MEKNFNYYLAIDIGASSGRHILGSLQDGKIVIEEVYRFENLPQEKDGHLIWDTVRLFSEIVNGIKKCKDLNKIPKSIGIDTWGVDYALLDRSDNLLGEVYCYRDNRTTNIMNGVHSALSQEELYCKTGIQSQQFNTVYQIADDVFTAKILSANSFLMLPDYFHFLLTGVKVNEYTNATTTGLVNAKSKTWDYEIINKLNFKEGLFNELSLPGTVVGNLKQEIQDAVGYNSTVVLPCTHDTASAVAAVPGTEENALYISSGTWSLMGVELSEALTTKESLNQKYTNEGGYNYKFRYLKNIMGLWLIQCIRHELDDKYSFSELVELAKNHMDFPSVFDVNDSRFLAPKSMIKAIQGYCRETEQREPEQVGEIAYCVYNSLAKAYSVTVKELETQTGKIYSKINIVGGGCKNEFLSELTAKYSGKNILAGPSEATAIGNLIVQMIADKKIENITKARELIKETFEITEVKF